MMSDLRKNIFSIKIWTVTTFCLLSLVNMNASNTLAHSLQKDEIKEVKDNPGKKVTGKSWMNLENLFPVHQYW